MRDFITGLQFLTTIRLWPETEWSSERFGRSVRYFPLVGAVIGLVLSVSYVLFSPWLPIHLAAALFIIGNILLTGGLHCDGFMDTMDGVLSGRSPERMLEIMKDSRVGANGVIAFLCLILLKWSILLDFPVAALPATLFAAPIIGRVGMVAAITSFPYARPQGIGKAFAEFAGGNSLLFALASGLVLISLLGWPIIVAALVGLIAGMLFARSASKRLGGITGDIYGAVTEITELCFFVAALVLTNFIVI
jgi:adenosylcobinamide-GDP ribazoletransferase